MKGILGDECSMSNITSASNEASISSSNNRNEIAALYNLQQQHSTSSFASPSADQTQTPKRKRNLPGNPDPEAEVIALSPTTLMTKNRFMCEICNKGFQRDQNLQLHRRGHNLPWKLKQRANKEVVKKKVYVCPEATCVHHDPSRALGDLTGIKKHFFRKHGEKKWKCEKCSKRYAVQSDWKAHSKICGTREYRCDCGTLFSRRDSFITHRAFCDALAEESSRSIINQNPQLLLSSQTAAATSSLLNHHLQPQMFHGSSHISFPFKREPDHHPQTSTFNLIRSDIPPWLASCPQGPGPGPPNIDHQVLQPSSQLFFSNSSGNASLQLDDQNPNPNLNNQGAAVLPSFPSTAASPHMSATALLQKAAQMGATMSKPSDTDHHNSMLILRPHQTHMFTPTTAGSSAALGLSSHEAAGLGASFGNNNKVIVTSGCMEHVGATTTATHHHQQQQQQHFGASSPNSLLLLHHDNSNNNSNNMNMMMSSSSTSGFGGSNFEEPFNGMLMNNKRDAHFQETRETHLGSGGGGGGGGGKDQGGDSMTRDFLGLRAFPHRDFIDMASLNQMNSSSLYDQHTTQDQSPWQG